MSPRINVDVHCSKFENHEQFPSVAHSLLAINDWPGGVEADERHDQEHQRKPARYGHNHESDIESAFPAGKAALRFNAPSAKIQPVLCGNAIPRPAQARMAVHPLVMAVAVRSVAV